MLFRGRETLENGDSLLYLQCDHCQAQQTEMQLSHMPSIYIPDIACHKCGKYQLGVPKRLGRVDLVQLVINKGD